MLAHGLPGTPVRGGLTCGVGHLEALPLDGVVRVEAQEHAAACGHDWLRLLAPTEAAQDGGLGITPIVYLQVIVSTLRLGLDVHLQEGLDSPREESKLGMCLGSAAGGPNPRSPN